MASPTRLESLREQPFTLALSAGYFGFFAHAGVLAALERADLRPARIVGVSAGALAGGLWAAGLSADALGTRLSNLRKEDFWDPGFSALGLLRGEKFAQLLADLTPCGVETIEACPIPFTAVAFDFLRWKTIAMQSGCLATAIRASCAVPGLFRPVRSGKVMYLDGGLGDRRGLSHVGEHERVLVHDLPPRKRLRLRSPQRLPQHPKRHVLCIENLPSLSPSRLTGGIAALEQARNSAEQWLLARLDSSV